VAGFVFFALVLSLGQALAGDSSSQNGSVGATVPATAPQITNFDMKTTGGSPATIIGTQIVVLTTYTFNFRVNAPNGWADVTHVYARIWHDGGADATNYAGQTSGANYKASLAATYSGASAPAVTDFSAVDGNIQYLQGSSSVTVVVASQTYDFVLAFQDHAQMRAAKTPTSLSTTQYNNAYSWNAEIEVTDASTNDVFQHQQTGTNDYFEFGVATYTSVTFTGPWTATASIAPGGSSNTNAVTITRISNFDFQLYAYFSTDMIKVGDATKTVPVASNVKILQTGDMGANGTFAGTGTGNKVYVLGSATPTNHTMDANADSGTVSVTFNIAVPLGTSVGTYQGTVVFTVQQKTPLP
jgi:hypothetical protein